MCMQTTSNIRSMSTTKQTLNSSQRQADERRGLDSDYLTWSKRALSGGGVGRRRTSRSGGPAGVVGHFVARSDQIRSDRCATTHVVWV